MKIVGRLIFAAVVVFALLQLVRPGIPTKTVTAEVQAPPAVRHILQKDCYSCHSDQPRLAWFDYVQPGYWLVRRDILTAQEHLDFSTLGSKPPAMQKAALYEAVNMIQLGAMPLPRFVALHPDAKVTPEELATLKAYLAPWAPSANRPGNSGGSTGGKTDAAPSAVSGSAPSPVSLASVHQEFNGIPFDPDFESWKMLSTTDRGDNNTFRFILGNDIAVRAAQSGNISPWPDGSRFAKIAWQQQPGADGIIHPGKFVQVELMIKDAHLYRNTEGWGWGRWRGLDLKPYGSDARFVNECTTCHLPVRGNDYVYTLPITAHQVSGEEIVNNRASLPASLPYQPLSWNAITMYVDPKTHTTATLFGNNLAMRSLKVRGGATAEMPVYPAGAVLALVTWVQREDPHWFGARIPDAPQSVEFVEVGSSTQTSHYGRYTGQGLAEDHVPPKEAAQRIGFVLNLSPARLP